MNSVQLIGRITRDPEVRYTQSNLAVCQMNVAINRGKDKEGNDRGADFPTIVVYGKQAENCAKYLAKGRLVAIEGRLQTGSYEKDGRKVYTTDVVASRVEFLEWGNKNNSEKKTEEKQDQAEYSQLGFQPVDDADDIPF